MMNTQGHTNPKHLKRARDRIVATFYIIGYKMLSTQYIGLKSFAYDSQVLLNLTVSSFHNYHSEIKYLDFLPIKHDRR